MAKRLDDHKGHRRIVPNHVLPAIEPHGTARIQRGYGIPQATLFLCLSARVGHPT